MCHGEKRSDAAIKHVKRIYKNWISAPAFGLFAMTIKKEFHV